MSRTPELSSPKLPPAQLLWPDRLRDTPLSQHPNFPVYRQRLDDERMEHLEGINPAYFFDVLIQWLNERPLIRWADRRWTEMAGLVAGEIAEFLAELLKIANSSGQELAPVWVKLWSEAMDIIFFLFSHLVATQSLSDLDVNTLMSKINGVGGSSGAFDAMMKKSDDIAQFPNLEVIKSLLRDLFSVLIHLEKEMPFRKAVQGVIIKNSSNYPSSCFQTEVNGKVIPPEEYEQAFNHRRQCLRLIRDVLALVDINTDLGIPKKHLSPYLSFICNHWQAKESLVSLIQRLAEDFKLPPAVVTQLAMKAGEKVVPSFSPSLQ